MPDIICKCFEFVSRSFIITVMKFAGIKANAIATKKTKLELFLVETCAARIFVYGKGELVNYIYKIMLLLINNKSKKQFYVKIYLP